MIIAIDGHSSCGKSTLAKQIAKKLNLIFIDTGAMYRAVTLYFLENEIDINSQTDFDSILENVLIKFVKKEDGNAIYLNEKDVSDEIRSLKVSNLVSEVAAIPEVRKKLVALQRMMAENGLVMDGRDIGSVVFPNADYKFFITADLQERARRRFQELKNSNELVDIDQVSKNLEHRDHIDSNRKISPLTELPDAIRIDTTHLSKEDQLKVMLWYLGLT